MSRFNRFIQEFGFYIFILFSTFVISLFESFLPLNIDFRSYYARLTILEEAIEDKMTNFSLQNLSLSPLWYIFVFVFMIIFFSALIIFFYLGFNFFSGKKIFPYNNFRPCPLWNMKDFFKILIWILFWMEVISIAHVFLGRFHTYNFRTYLTTSLLGNMLVDIVVIVILVYWLKRHYRQKIIAVGIPRGNTARNFKTAVFYYLGFLPVLFALIYAGIILAHRVQKPVPPQPLFYFLVLEKNKLILGITLLFVVIIGPVAEELFFRGLFYNALKKSIGVFQAMVITSILFAVLHMNVLGFLPIFGLAMLFVLMYERTGCLKIPIFLHMIHNGFLAGIVMFVRVLMQL